MYKIMDFNELSELGLIWKINKDILHPLGLALSRNEDGISSGCLIAPDGIWEYSEEDNIEYSEKYNSFIQGK